MVVEETLEIQLEKILKKTFASKKVTRNIKKI